MGIPFDEINHILLHDDLDTIAYGKLKKLLAYFISGKKPQNKPFGFKKKEVEEDDVLLDAIFQFRKNLAKPSADAITGVGEASPIEQNAKTFLEKNKKAFDNLQFYIHESDRVALNPKFDKMIEITKDLLYENIKTEEDYKNIIKKYIPDLSKTLTDFQDRALAAFGIQHRSVREKHKNKLKEIDEKRKATVNFLPLGDAIKDIISVYGKTESKKVFSKIGINGGADVSSLFVGYLSTDIVYDTGGNITQIGSMTTEQTKEMKEKFVYNTDIFNDINNKISHFEIKVDDILKFFKIVFYTATNEDTIDDNYIVPINKMINEIFNKAAYHDYYYKTYNTDDEKKNFLEQIKNISPPVFNLLTELKKNITKENLLNFLWIGLEYFVNVINDKNFNLPSGDKTYPELKNFVGEASFTFKNSPRRTNSYSLSTDIKYMIEIDFLSKKKGDLSDLDQTLLKKIFRYIFDKNIQFDHLFDNSFSKLDNVNFTSNLLKQLRVFAFIQLYKRQNNKNLENKEIKEILENIKKYENEIYFNTDISRQETFYNKVLFYMLGFDKELPFIYSFRITQKNRITIYDYISLNKQYTIHQNMDIGLLQLNPLLIIKTGNVTEFIENNLSNVTDIHSILKTLKDGNDMREIPDTIDKSYLEKLKSLLEVFDSQIEEYKNRYTPLLNNIKNYLFDGKSCELKELTDYEITYRNIKNIILIINAKPLYELLYYTNKFVAKVKKTDPVVATPETNKNMLDFTIVERGVRYVADESVKTFHAKSRELLITIHIINISSWEPNNKILARSIIREIVNNTYNFDNDELALEFSTEFTDNDTSFNITKFFSYYFKNIRSIKTGYTLGNINTTDGLQKDIRNFKIKPTVIKELKKGGGGYKRSVVNMKDVIIQDRIYFILMLFIIRTLSLFIIDVAIKNGSIKKLSQCILIYFTIYMTVFILLIIFSHKEAFYYLNTDTEDGKGIFRIILQFTCICSLIPVPYIVKDIKELDDITLYLFILASIVTLIV